MYKVEYRVKDAINPANLSDVKFNGRIGQKLDRVIYERLTSDYARDEVFGEAESAFENMADDRDAPLGIWQGEFWGKQMISACRAYRYNGDESLKKIIRESCYRVMSHQREDGYLGTYKNEKQIFRVSHEIGMKMKGWECEWTWNIWCRKYTLWALVEAYQVLLDGKILEAAEKSASHLIDMLREMGARIGETGMFYGQPSGSILKPMLVLYRLCKNKKYLDFAIQIADEWEDSDTCCTKLITSALSKAPIHEWGYTVTDIVPKSKYNPCTPEGEPVFDVSLTTPETSGKVYEMQSCFDGLLELYRVTGTPRYLEAVKCFFELMLKDEYNPLCSVGFNDIFINAGKYQNTLSELCDVIHFIRLATELHKVSGEPRYLDFAELAFCNCFLAGVTRDGKWGARAVRAAESHLFVHLQAEFTKNHCCTNNMPRGFFNIAESTVMTDKDSVYLNFFTETEATARFSDSEYVSFYISQGYLTTQELTVKVNANITSEKQLKLRIPEWSKYTVVKVNGKSYAVNKCGYFTVPLLCGESEIYLHFDSTPRLVNGKYNFKFYPLSPYMYERYRSGTKVSEDTIIDCNHATLFVGPVLLAMSKDLGSTKEKIFDRETVCGRVEKVETALRNDDGFACSFDVTFTLKDGERITVPMGDFASASDNEEICDHRYSIFI